MSGGTIRPGVYLRDMREAAGLSAGDVAATLHMLKLGGRFLGPWRGLSRLQIARAILEIEADRRRPTSRQLLGLALVFPIHLPTYRKYASRLKVRDALTEATHV